MANNFYKTFIGKSVVSRSGKRLGIVGDLVFEIRTGELLHFILDKPTQHIESMKIDKGKEGEILVPFTSVTSSEDFVMVNEEDLL